MRKCSFSQFSLFLADQHQVQSGARLDPRASFGTPSKKKTGAHFRQLVSSLCLYVTESCQANRWMEPDSSLSLSKQRDSTSLVCRVLVAPAPKRLGSLSGSAQRQRGLALPVLRSALGASAEHASELLFLLSTLCFLSLLELAKLFPDRLI